MKTWPALKLLTLYLSYHKCHFINTQVLIGMNYKMAFFYLDFLSYDINHLFYDAVYDCRNYQN